MKTYQKPVRISRIILLSIFLIGIYGLVFSLEQSDEKKSDQLQKRTASDTKVLSDIKSSVVKIFFWYKGGINPLFSDKQTIAATTSGVVIDSDGKILTHNSVKGNISVYFNDGQKVPAQILKTDDELQLSLLKADLHDLKPATISKDIPHIGENVIAAGFEGQGDAQTFKTEIGKITYDKYEIPSSKPFYGYYITTDITIGYSNLGLTTLFNEHGELLSVVGLFSQTGTPPSIFYPITNIPREKLDAFIK